MLLKMSQKRTEKSKPLDPLNDKPLKIIKKFLDSDSIRNPEKAFRFSINEESKNIRNKQIHLHELNIMSAIKRNEYYFVKYLLDELNKLKNNLNESDITNTYTSE